MTSLSHPSSTAAACAFLCCSALAAASATGEGAYVPPSRGAWQTTTPAQAGFDAQKLEAALDFAFEHDTSDLVILHGGRIVAERHQSIADAPTRYRNMLHATTEDGRPIEDVASVQKSLVSLLIGIARERGELDLDRPVTESLGSGWSRAPRNESQITVRHLLQMTSGLDPSLSSVAEPGTTWRYNTNAYSKLVPVLEKATGRPLGSLTAEWLTQPLGMLHSGWAPRPWVAAGADANSQGFTTTARDLARLGLLVLRRGEWGERRLVPTSWIDEATTTSQPHNPAYGLLWWTRVEEGSSVTPDLAASDRFSTAPEDLIAALGALGRRLYVVPSLDLVITRLGAAPGEDFDRDFWRLLTEARRNGP